VPKALKEDTFAAMPHGGSTDSSPRRSAAPIQRGDRNAESQVVDHGDEARRREQTAGQLRDPSQCRQHSASHASEPALSPLAASQPAWHWTWRVLQAGFSIAEVCAIRNLEPLTVLDHATTAASQGLGLPIEPFRNHAFDPTLRSRVDRLVELLRQPS
jgi:hypothetical protein